jgi:hypothetical protein
LPAGDLADGEAVAVIRPEAFTVDDGGALVSVKAVRFAGAHHEIDLAVGPVSARMRIACGTLPSLGSTRVSIDPSRARVFALA